MQAQAAKDAAAQKAGEVAQGAKDTTHSYAEAAQQGVGSMGAGMGTMGTGVGTSAPPQPAGGAVYTKMTTTTTSLPSGAVATAPAVPVVGIHPPFEQHTTTSVQKVRRGRLSLLQQQSPSCRCCFYR